MLSKRRHEHCGTITTTATTTTTSTTTTTTTTTTFTVTSSPVNTKSPYTSNGSENAGLRQIGSGVTLQKGDTVAVLGCAGKGRARKKEVWLALVLDWVDEENIKVQYLSPCDVRKQHGAWSKAVYAAQPNKGEVIEGSIHVSREVRAVVQWEGKRWSEGAKLGSVWNEMMPFNFSSPRSISESGCGIIVLLFIFLIFVLGSPCYCFY